MQITFAERVHHQPQLHTAAHVCSLIALWTVSARQIRPWMAYQKPRGLQANMANLRMHAQLAPPIQQAQELDPRYAAQLCNKLHPLVQVKRARHWPPYPRRRGKTLLTGQSHSGQALTQRSLQQPVRVNHPFHTVICIHYILCSPQLAARCYVPFRPRACMPGKIRCGLCCR